jgi:predicted RNase H-like HicB family nuclease
MQIGLATIVIDIVPDPEYGGFSARIPDIPAYGEGETEEEAIADLRNSLTGYIEAFGVADAISRIAFSIMARSD